VLLLQPTSPLRNTEDIDGCLSLVERTNAKSVVSVTEADIHPYWTYRLSADQTMTRFVDGAPIARRQDLPEACALNGAMYFAQAQWLRDSGSLVGVETLAYVMSKEHSVDLDTPLDWKFAELLMKESL
jgi:CMP-N,N'-diacetyllegionaminic acid synthase